ncbi:uncharacterized protein EAF01_000948 [Botrytis porri]|uniref:uncharacterized protein n=1 Tax=Botrytis porri TaxID=87229 RepID=UPI0018FF5AB7|nr:uncharacterized protein EAF01_000948 [Botrytis porri]KAF7914542.1 hypothetical protein EAF01_000948 [Botrytis porri]
MLSQLTTSVSQTTSPLIRYGSISTSVNLLRITNHSWHNAQGLLSNRGPHNQTRAFRMGYWSSYLDHGFEKELNRRQRLLKQKCAEAESVKRDERIPDYKRAMHNFMRSKTIYFSPARSKYTFKADVEGADGGVESIRLSQADEAYWRNLKSKNQLDNEFELEDENYHIDPITNRKVFNNEKAVKIPVTKFKGYRQRFQNLVPPDDATQADIDAYNKPFMYNEPDGKFPEKPDSVRESLKEYDSKLGYKAYLHNEPDGQPPQKADPIQEGLKDYDSCASYNAFRYREPDGKLPEQPDCVQESLKDYDSHTTYGFFRHNEPDGKLPEKPDSVRESLKDYDADTSYGSFRYNEPDGKFPEKPDTVQESLKEYDTSNSYGSFRYNEPDGKLPEKPDSVRESLKDYDADTSYGSFRYNEPDGKFPESPDKTREALKEYDQKQAKITQHPSSDKDVETKPSLSSRFSRKYPESDRREDLDLLRASDIRAASGIIKSTKKETPEEKSTKREQLEKAFEEAHQNVIKYAQEIASEQKLKGQTQTKIQEISGPSVSKTGELSETLDQKDHKYVGQVEKRKVTGNFVRDFPEEFEKSWTQQKDGAGELMPAVSKDAWGYDKSPKGLELSYSMEVKQSVQKAEKEYIEGLGSKEAFSRNPNTPRLQTSLDRSVTKSTSLQPNLAKTVAEIDPYSKVPQGLETSFKEECANQGEGDFSVYVSSYGKPRKQSGKDKDLVREIRGIYEDTYGKIGSQHRQIPASDAPATSSPGEKPASGPEPTTYKVLAYDSTMQSINIAETTSIVTDTASALTPAEVLLRLSNPAKFFPHFQPLQAEGYEIVSGSGDVLVFRKVRSARRLSSQADLKNNTINPIDGMQVPTARFASPTGFVNHDLPESAEPPFKSNIDVRREEPVFSGKSSWKDHSEVKSKKPGKAKRVLLGGAIVGSGCYAIGVVTEFFRTGGVDGKGPQGF